MNSAWKHMRILGSISRNPLSRPESVAIQFTTKAHSKLRSRWDGPFVITNIFPYGVVNGHQIKPFYEGPAPVVGDMEIISLMEPAPPDGIT
ncbi:hypothetical protein CR513_16606, partial [Mucuna pruriens]